MPAPSPPTPAAPVEAAPAPASEDEIERQVWQTVQAWADAWSGQRADAYLGFYGRDFVPPDGSARSDWEALRRRRLTAPGFIRISLALLEIERPAPERAITRFVQSYESDRFRDTVTKVLELARTDAGWRIVCRAGGGASLAMRRRAQTIAALSVALMAAGNVAAGAGR